MPLELLKSKTHQRPDRFYRGVCPSDFCEGRKTRLIYVLRKPVRSKANNSEDKMEFNIQDQWIGPNHPTYFIG